MKRSAILLILVLAVLAVWRLASLPVERASAQEAQPTPTPGPAGSLHGSVDCLTCHSKPGLSDQFANGETISITFDIQQHTSKIHSELGCTACHENQKTYPHLNSSQASCLICHPFAKGGQQAGPLLFKSAYQDGRAFVLDTNAACQNCHADISQAATDSIHTRILAQGNRFAPVCADCHGSHDIVQINGSRSAIPLLCSKCHLAEYSTYRTSVHGSALEEQSNPDVPTCVDCHGVHNITGPIDIRFRADSIYVCGNCHSNKTLMAKYNLSTDVLSTYLDDYHGRMVDFVRMSGEVQVTQATCYDCHGIHNILNPSDPRSSVYPDNLQKTCGQCHKDDNIRFPQAWLGHVIPTLQKSPVLYTVNLAYKVIVPAVMGGFAVYIAIDARRRLAGRLKKLRKPSEAPGG